MNTPRLITYNGTTKSLTEWAKELGLLPHTLFYRLRYLPLEKALVSKKYRPHTTEARITYQGNVYSLPELAAKVGIPYSTLRGRYSVMKMPIEQAILKGKRL